MANCIVWKRQVLDFELERLEVQILLEGRGLVPFKSSKR